MCNAKCSVPHITLTFENAGAKMLFGKNRTGIIETFNELGVSAVQLIIRDQSIHREKSTFHQVKAGGPEVSYNVLG